MGIVCIVEDDGAVAASLEAVLHGWAFKTRTFSSGEAFLEAKPNADCILLDVRLPGKNGLAVLEDWRKINPATPVIVITGHGDIRTAVKAFHAGAQDFIEKPFNADDLVERINAAIRHNAETTRCQKILDRMTPRELEVMKEVVAGYPNKIIAYHLGISQKTVELHRARVMEKAEAQSASHLVRIAMTAKLDFDLPPA
ncbi:MAG: response regulator [Silicimonas sp.]|nr:response regulator [Silicimonas sp.]